MRKTLFLTLFLLLVMLPALPGCATVGLGSGNVPKAADSIAEQMDKQLLARYTPPKAQGQSLSDTMSGPSREEINRSIRGSITIMGTVPVNINNLEMSCPLARQMTEEISRWLVNAGYHFQELRKGKDIYFEKQQGEMLLTRDTKLLASRSVVSQAILVGTYVVSPEQVRFSMRLLHTPSNEVLAQGTATVPITPDVPPLLVNTGSGPVKIEPSVNTRLQ